MKRDVIVRLTKAEAEIVLAYLETGRRVFLMGQKHAPYNNAVDDAIERIDASLKAASAS